MKEIAETENLLAPLMQGDRHAFDKIYHRLLGDIFMYVHGRLRDRMVSEEIVQEVFVSLWMRRADLDPDTKLGPYLFAAAKYRMLSHIRSEKVRSRYAAHLSNFLAHRLENNVKDGVDLADLYAVIEEQLAVLPPKCRQAFRLSRFSERSISEISAEMNISTRTVENYITQALRHLRKQLRQHQWLLLLVLT